MSDTDRQKWNEKYAGAAPRMGAGPKSILKELSEWLPRSGRALDIAAGEGQTALWLAGRGMSVTAIDVAEVALAKAERSASELALPVQTLAWDLDRGLPPDLGCFGLITCLHFRDPSLMEALREALAPGGLLLVEQPLSDAHSLGLPAPRSLRFLARPQELLHQAQGLRIRFYREGVSNGRALATLLAEAPPADP